MQSRVSVYNGHAARRRDAGIVLTAVILAMIALDDITTDLTDPDPTFMFERLGLFVCGIALAIVVTHLLRQGQPWLGGSSLVLLIGAAWFQQFLRPTAIAAHPLAYAVVVGAVLWFIVLAALLWFPGGEHRR